MNKEHEGRCKACAKWRSTDRELGFGECRAKSPEPNGPNWAITTENDWCGEYEYVGMFHWLRFTDHEPEDNDFITATRITSKDVLEGGVTTKKETFDGFYKDLPKDGKPWEWWQV